MARIGDEPAVKPVVQVDELRETKNKIELVKARRDLKLLEAEADSIDKLAERVASLEKENRRHLTRIANLESQLDDADRDADAEDRRIEAAMDARERQLDAREESIEAAENAAETRLKAARAELASIEAEIKQEKFKTLPPPTPIIIKPEEGISRPILFALGAGIGAAFGLAIAFGLSLIGL